MLQGEKWQEEGDDEGDVRKGEEWQEEGDDEGEVRKVPFLPGRVLDRRRRMGKRRCWKSGRKRRCCKEGCRNERRSYKKAII